MKLLTISKSFNNVKKEELSKYLELMPDFKQEKTQKFTTIVLTLVASIILGLFAINPTLSTIANLQKQLDDNKFVEQKLEEKINNLSILQQKYATLQPDLDAINSAIPKTADSTALLGQIQAVAQKSNLSIMNLQTLEVDIPPQINGVQKYSAYAFALSAQGNYQDMMNFLNELSNIQRVVVVNNFGITKFTDNNASSLRLIVKGTVYYKE